VALPSVGVADVSSLLISDLIEVEPKRVRCGCLAGVDPLPNDAAVVETTMKEPRRSLGAAPAKKAPAMADVANGMAEPYRATR
jgi:hypothetical protein